MHDFANNKTQEYENKLRSEITLLKWLAHGRMLIIADAIGNVLFYGVDPTMPLALNIVTKHHRNGKVVSVEERVACTRNYYLNT